MSQMSINSFIVLILNLLVIKLSECHPSGAPEDVCPDLIPQHKVSEQTKPFPYQLVARLANNSIELIIESQTNIKFRGFAIQARVVNGSNEPIGEFVVADSENSHTINCGGGLHNTITHSNRNDKQRLSVIWNPTKTLDKDIVIEFVGTVVKDAKTFWINQSSEPIIFGTHEVIKGNALDEHKDHKNGLHSEHSKNGSKLTNSSQNTSLDYLLILSTILLLCRRN